MSWNVYALNKQVPDAFTFIQSLDFDILCLQEVPDSLLEMLRTLPFHLATSIDNTWVTDALHPEQGESTMHLVILSKHSIEKTAIYPYPPLPTKKPLQMQAFHIARYAIGMWRGGAIRGRTTLAAWIQIGEKTIQVFSAHLSLYTPQTRAAEFEVIAQHLDSDSIPIVCGDFNTLDYWMMRPLNWLQGGRLADAMPWARERENVEAQFKKANLMNPLSGKSTHPVAKSQLDHILLPPNTPITDSRVLFELHGSDHYPVKVSIQV